MHKSRPHTSHKADWNRSSNGMRKTHSLKDEYDYYDKWIGSIVRVDNISDATTDTTLIGVFRSAGRIRHIHIELVHNSASDFRYAVIIYHKPQHARLATALSGMMIRGHYIAVTLVNSCCEIIPYSPQTMNDVLLEQRERFYLHSNIPQVSIFDSATSVPLMMNKVDLFTTPHPSTCLPPSDCIESGSKLDEKDSDVKFLLDAAEMVVLHGRELDDRRFISDYDVSQKDEKKEVKGVAKERKMEKQKCVSQRADYNDWEDIVDLPEVCKLKANEDSRVKPLGNSRIINTNNHATHGNHHYYIKKHHRAS